MGKIYELGGPDIFTVHELVIFLSASQFLVVFQVFISELVLPCRQSLCMIQSVNILTM